MRSGCWRQKGGVGLAVQRLGSCQLSVGPCALNRPQILSPLARPSERPVGTPRVPRCQPRGATPATRSRSGSSAPRLPIIAVILVGGEVLPDLPVGLPYPLAEALELAAQRAAESGEIRLHAASGAALRHAAARPAPRCAAPRGGASARCCFFSTTDSGSRGPGPRGDLCFS